jgi:hypothetical protein
MVAPSRFVTLSVLVYLSGQLLSGQTARAPGDVPPEVRKHIEAVTSCLRPPVVIKDDPRPCPMLSERMSQLRVLGVSVAVIHNGSIEWARGFGLK